MIEMAALEPSSLAQMCQFLPVKPQTVSYHLKILLDSGLVHCPLRWDGRFAYVPNAARLEQLQIYIDSCLMPSSRLEARGRIVCRFEPGEYEAKRAALERYDQGCRPLGKRAPETPEHTAEPPSLLHLLGE